MRILVDLQAAQCHSRSDDVGRYSIAFAKAIIAQAAGAHEVLVVLNGCFADTIDELSTEFASLIPKDCIRVFELPGPLAEARRENLWRTRTGELLRENFIADFRPDIVHSAALFDGWQNDFVISIDHLSGNFSSVVSLLDSALLESCRDSSGDLGVAQFRRKRVHLLKNADLVFTVSEAAREQTITALNLRVDRVVHIPPGLEISSSKISPRPVMETPAGLHLPPILCALEDTDDAERCLSAFSSLPDDLRKTHQILLAGKPVKEKPAAIMMRARDHGLAEREVVMIEFLEASEHLYSSVALAVFPSTNTQIGLSLLYAMAAGAPVIGSSSGILPELIGREDALFDPTDPGSLAARITNFLREPDLRRSLQRWSAQRAQTFTWKTAVQKALAAMEEIHANRQARAISRVLRKPRLAFVSPFPPEKTGIAGYSARLVPSLSEYYDVVCIANHRQITDPLLTSRFAIRDVQWFEQHGGRFDRILYQFGNSPAHKKMFGLLEQYTGVAVLHDFFLSDVLSWMQESGYLPGSFCKALNDSHGLPALVADSRNRRRNCVANFPCNISVLRDSAGVIVHSNHAVDLARDWYGATASSWMRRVPFLPRQSERKNQVQARERLQIPIDAFVVCSFGWITPFKLSDAILRAWLASPLKKNEKCFLIFIGGIDEGAYGKAFGDKVAGSQSQTRIRITGYVDEQQYTDYLTAADLAIQLRTQSRGETSATIFDCLAQGVPLIVNAHGSAAELPEDVVIKIDDEFTDEELIHALTSFHASPERRRNVALRATWYLENEHRPESIAKMYHDFIEEVNETSPRSREQRLLKIIAESLGPVPPSPADLGSVAIALSANRLPFGLPRIFVDITNITKLDLRTGIERVTRGVLMSLISAPPAGFRIEPVRAVAGGYVYARRFIAEALHFARSHLADDAVEAKRSDIFLGVDWPADVLPSLKTWFQQQKRHGMRTVFVIYDLLPLLRPDLFPPELSPMTRGWLNAVTEIADGVVCISRTVADELHQWLNANKPSRFKPLPIGFFQLGADLHASLPTKGLPDEALEMLATIRRRPTFLMVGTVEPRKGHRQALGAMELLWKDQNDLNLVIIGKRGWMMEDFAERVQKHPERDKRLFWLQGISDEMLEQIYRSSRALLAASEGEGFGLPLIEAAQYGIPIIARNLPVFREVASDHAFYFDSSDETALADALIKWLALADKVPGSARIHWYTWQESTRDLLDVVIQQRWYRSWTP